MHARQGGLHFQGLRTVGVDMVAKGGVGIYPARAGQLIAVSGVAVHTQGGQAHVGDGGCVQGQAAVAVAGEVNGADAADLARA